MFWLQVTEQNAQQGGFAGTVGSDQADLVTAHHPQAEVVDHGMLVKGLGNPFYFQYQLARRFSLLQGKAGIALHFPALTSLFAQFFQITHPAFVTGAPGLDALANPRLFLGQFFIEQGVLLRFYLKGVGFAFQVGVVIAVPTGQLTTIQLNNASGQ